MLPSLPSRVADRVPRVGEGVRSPDHMTESIRSCRVVVSNPQGLHARPADMFVKRANQFKSRINVLKDGERVDGKSILGVLTLVAEQGTELCIEASGPDADRALEVLADLFDRGFEEIES